jgi:UDP-N-acetylglucosamine 4,6-dehydratase
MNRNDYSIIIGVKERELANPVLETLNPLQGHILVGQDYPSFSKLVNDAIVLCPNEIVIFCSHRVRPTPQDIQTLLERIDEGYGVATLYRFGCFGFRKEVARRVGFFDERYRIGGWEDNDFILRLQEKDIAYYEDESIPYVKGDSLWVHPPDKPLVSREHFFTKWEFNTAMGTVTRTVPEIHVYDVGPSDTSIHFKKWSESHLLNFSKWQQHAEILPAEHVIRNKSILIFGGTGSLGNKIIDIHGNKNKITVFSRDENKHWHMSSKYPNVSYLIGDITDYKRVSSALVQVNPDIIIIAAALKHVDRCEYEVETTYNTNCLGVQNVIDAVKDKLSILSNLSSVVFVSTDKACSPVNTYGITKALAEKVMVETAYKMKHVSPIKFVTVRYGNILNSRGSIIEILNKIGQSIMPSYNLTDESMTRFVMTQEDSVRLINFAITRAASGDIVVPKLHAMKIKDLIEIFAEKYNKTITVTGLRPGEKIAEALLNDTEFPRVDELKSYFIIKPPYNCTYKVTDNSRYDSSVNVLEKHVLINYLKFKEFI